MAVAGCHRTGFCCWKLLTSNSSTIVSILSKVLLFSLLLCFSSPQWQIDELAETGMNLTHSFLFKMR